MLKELFTPGGFPNLSEQEKRPFLEKLGTVLIAYGIIFLSYFIIVPLVLTADYMVVHLWHYKSLRGQSAITFQHIIQKLGFVRAVLYICIIGPILEEAVFRLPLSFKKQHIALGIACAVFLFSSALPFVKTQAQNLGYYFLLIRIAVIAVVYLISIKLLPNKTTPGTKLKTRLIIGSILLFGLMHIANYAPVQWAFIWIYPVFVLPQLFMGWLLTYVRFKNGFIWGIALHCLINSVSMTFYTNFTKPLQKIQQKHAIAKPQPKI